jgi:hypothetical protein
VTRITLQDGKIVLRDGKAGTEQACCCDGEGGCCCVDFGVDPDLTTRAECEAAGGDWIPGRDCEYQDINDECLALVPGQNDWLFCLSGWPVQATGSGPGQGPFVFGDDLYFPESVIIGPKQGLIREITFPDRFIYSDPNRVFQLAQRCGLWHLSINSGSTNPDWFVSWSFNGFIKPVDPTVCDPSGTVTGPIFWTGANGSGSQQATFTVEVGDCQ